MGLAAEVAGVNVLTEVVVLIVEKKFDCEASNAEHAIVSARSTVHKSDRHSRCDVHSLAVSVWRGLRCCSRPLRSSLPLATLLRSPCVHHAVADLAAHIAYDSAEWMERE